MAVAGNKADLKGEREVDTAEVTSYAESIGAVYFETSAKDGTNVETLFETLLKKLPACVPRVSEEVSLT